MAGAEGVLYQAQALLLGRRTGIKGAVMIFLKLHVPALNQYRQWALVPLPLSSTRPGMSCDCICRPLFYTLLNVLIACICPASRCPKSCPSRCWRRCMRLQSQTCPSWTHRSCPTQTASCAASLPGALPCPVLNAPVDTPPVAPQCSEISPQIRHGCAAYASVGTPFPTVIFVLQTSVPIILAIRENQAYAGARPGMAACAPK